MKKKLLICAVLCGGAFVAAKNVDLIQEKLFNGKDQDEFLKILDVACSLCDGASAVTAGRSTNRERYRN